MSPSLALNIIIWLQGDEELKISLSLSAEHYRPSSYSHVTGMHHNAWLMECLGSNPGPHAY